MQLFKSHRDGIADGDQRRDFIYVDDVVRGDDVAAGDALGQRHLQCRHRQGAQLSSDLMLAAYAALGTQPNIDYVDMPEQIRGSYQYFTQSEVDRLRARRLQWRLHAAGRCGRGLCRRVISIAPTASADAQQVTSSMFDFDALSHAIASQTVLCVGDLMLDEFVYGEVSRISPEAPAPVIAVQRSETNIGGAGNVARNIAALGARCIFVGLVGEDDAGATLKAALAQEAAIESVLVVDPSRPTTRKVRFVSEHFSTHMLRADWELAQPASAEIEQKLIDAILPQLPRADIVLLSDYAKGVLTARVIRDVIDAARKARQARDRRSQERQLRDLSRRDAAHAEPQGICRGDPQPRRHRRRASRDAAQRRDAAGRLRSHAGDAERTRHDAGAARRRGRSMCRRTRSRCATCPAPATPSPRRWR